MILYIRYVVRDQVRYFSQEEGPSQTPPIGREVTGPGDLPEGYKVFGITPYMTTANTVTYRHPGTRSYVSKAVADRYVEVGMARYLQPAGCLGHLNQRKKDESVYLAPKTKACDRCGRSTVNRWMCTECNDLIENGGEGYGAISQQVAAFDMKTIDPAYNAENNSDVSKALTPEGRARRSKFYADHNEKLFWLNKMKG